MLHMLADGNGSAMVVMLVYLAVIVVVIAGFWKVFEKAGKPGWAAIVPIYNMWVMAEIAGKEGWFGLLCLIPLVGIVFMIIIMIGVAQAFGKGVGYGLGLCFLSFIFWPMLGFGSDRYLGAPTAPRGFAPVMPGQQPPPPR
jgi:hypothetical protein